MKRLAKPLVELQSHYDAIVIGSGYGGGVAASRLSRMGFENIAVLERGKEKLPGEFPDTAAKAMKDTQISSDSLSSGDGDELFDLRINRDVNVLVGCGLGGTSLINANVAIEADERVFKDSVWPENFIDSDLDEGFKRAREMLAPVPYPSDREHWPVLNKMRAMEQAAHAHKATLEIPPIAVNFENKHNAAGILQTPCNLCGDCCSGCNVGAKNTTAMNYLPDAAARGAEIFCGIGVRWIKAADADSGLWVVGYQPIGSGRGHFDAEELRVTADIVVLAAGTLGSTEILLRSRKEQGLSLSKALGSRFSGNGDVLAFGYNNDVQIDGIGLGDRSESFNPRSDKSTPPVGPTITSLIDLPNKNDVDQGMIIEEGAIPGGLANFLPAAMAAASKIVGKDTDLNDSTSELARELKSFIPGPYRDAVNHTQTYLVMSHDDSDGKLVICSDRLCVDWPGAGKKPIFQKISKNLQKATKANGGTYIANPIWSDMFDHDLVTVHPLGGCPMGNDAASAVVDKDCRVFSSEKGNQVYQGLYVCDGAVIPRSLGVNPLLTITAIAERAMINLSKLYGRNIDMTAAVPQPPLDQSDKPVGLNFTEKMTGSVTSFNGGDKSDASFVATVVVDDVSKFLDESAHEANLVGTVVADALSESPLTIIGGLWNLFVKNMNRVETKQMVYKMPLVAKDGKEYYFYGTKTIHDDKGFDLWRDTTTLDISIHKELDGSGEKLIEGTLHIEPKDFINQLRTMTVTDAPDFITRIKTLVRFGQFFSGELFQTFGGALAKTSRYDPGIVRVKRPLRADTPEISHFETIDGKKLRFTRYKGGAKGPVILSHGLGVSSKIFTIDTIDTNLLEYLFAAGYDCWLLDYRASIDLGYATEQANADDIAEKDYPAAIKHVCGETGSDDVQMIAHCYGAMTFSMAMLLGMKGVRSAVISQISANAIVPWWPQRLLAWLRAPDIMRFLGVSLLDARASKQDHWFSRFVDKIIGLFYPFNHDDRTKSLTSRRITALYGQLYQLDQLNQATMDAMPEMFGKSNISAFRHLTKIARTGHVVPAKGNNSYLSESSLKNFAIPTLFVHGDKNRTFDSAGTKLTMSLLQNANGAQLYDRHIVKNTGHIDCIFGKNAARDVYPKIVEHLDKTA